jgi:hypothetical protein
MVMSTVTCKIQDDDVFRASSIQGRHQQTFDGRKSRTVVCQQGGSGFRQRVHKQRPYRYGISIGSVEITDCGILVTVDAD